MILVNGCSFCQGQSAWPNHLTTFDQKDIVNLSCSSAGNTYIHESTINALSRLSVEAVLIMWSGLTRVDTTVEDVSQFDNSWYTSKFASAHNDWPSKTTSLVNDQDYVDKNWVFGLGEQNRDSVITDSKLFKGIYTHLGQPQFIFHFLMKLISLQNTLKAMEIPYVFMFYQPYQNQLQTFPDLCKIVDWNNIYIDKNIWDLANNNKDIDSTGHPGVATHKQWGNIVDNIIKTKLLKGIK
jgi:hypothetical protein